MPSSHAASMSSNAWSSVSPPPKNSGADPTPPKLPQPSATGGISAPATPAGLRFASAARAACAGSGVVIRVIKSTLRAGAKRKIARAAAPADLLARMSQVCSDVMLSENDSVPASENRELTVTFAGSGDAFGSCGRFQACIHLQPGSGIAPVLLDCGATSLTALKQLRLDPGEVTTVFVSHLHGDHFGGLPFLILDGQFSRRTTPLTIAGPPGITKRLTDTMECLFPGSSSARRRFDIRTVEIEPGTTTAVADVT